MWTALAVWVLDVAFFSTAGTNLSQVGQGNLSPLGLIGFAALGAAALIWRRRAPLLVFGIVWLHAMVGMTLVAGYQPVLAVLVMVYTIGAHRPVRQAWVIAPAVAPNALAAVNEAWKSTPDRRVLVFLGLLGFFTLLSAGVWALGNRVAASRRRLAESERLRRVEAELAVAQERARISRELHDIVAHTVTVMVLQAAGAQRILQKNPDRAEQALGQIADLGRAAMNELRRMVSLHNDSGSDSSAAEPAQPPGLANLPELLDRVRGGGIAVTFAEEGRPRRVDPSVGLAAYRAVQEALTNTAKHAGPGASAEVRLVWTDDLLVEVTDGGTKAIPATSQDLSTGHGLIGLRERVAVVGGRFDSGPRDDGGFRLAVSLPVTA
jgi:signal transduction histidine kinase